MKRLFYYKQLATIDEAHLYEHLYGIALSNFFTKHDLYQYIDYSLANQTLAPGLVILDIELYTKDAIELTTHITAQPLDLSDESVIGAITQIIAEEEKPVVVKNPNELKKILAEAHSRDWEQTSSLENLDTTGEQTTDGVFYIAEGTPQPATQLSLNVSVNTGDSPELALDICHMIIENTQINFADVFDIYSFEDLTETKKDIVSMTNNFRVSSLTDIQKDDVIRYVHTLASSMRKSGAIERFAKTRNHSTKELNALFKTVSFSVTLSA